MAQLTLKLVVVFLVCSFASVRFFVPLIGQEFLSRCLATIVSVVISYVIASKMTSGGKIISTRGKAVLITGCDTGMGNALARRLDGLGFRVFAGCLFAERDGASRLRDECSEKLKVVQLDVISEKQIADAVSVVETILATSGDVLWGVVNNAGIALFGGVEWISMDAFKNVMDVNLWGMVRVTKAFMPLIRNSKGRVVNMSSMLGRFSSPYCAAYCMAKYAVQSFTDVLRIEMQQWGVKAVIVEPGTFSAGGSAMLQEDTLNSGIDIVWSSAPSEVQEAYGEEYFQSVKKALILPVLKTSHSSIYPVLDAYTNALTDQDPKERYFPSNALCKCIAWANYYLPATIMDFAINMYLHLFLAKLQGLKTS